MGRWKDKKVLYKTNNSQDRHFVLISGYFDNNICIGGYWTGGEEKDFPFVFNNTTPIVIPSEFALPMLNHVLSTIIYDKDKKEQRENITTAITEMTKIVQNWWDYQETNNDEIVKTEMKEED